MAKTYALLLAFALLLGAHNAIAAQGDVRTCALNKVVACDPDSGCEEWSVQDVDLPRFVRLDLAAKKITSLDKTVARDSSIATVQRLQGLTVLHGTELRGWTAALDEDTGDFTLSAAGPGEGFVVFGSCIMP
jgi:hypothetical protein